ncbi:hypothetical protein [Marinagarivorans algicola]|uniref:hypothetical protein n=1 Tax=Marinagarivorans algicola TaxID=1513270 RepID=UPI0006B631F7|nr:hypothetical protein [Marinagarivorans algicola]
MKSAIGLLACAVLVCSVVAAFWLEQNKDLRFKVRQLERQIMQLELTDTATVLIPQASCQPSSLAPAVKPFDEMAMAAMCAPYINERDTNIDAKPIMNAEQSQRIVLQKYRLLLQALTLAPKDTETLMALFAQREALLNAPVQDYYASQKQVDSLIMEQQEALTALDMQVYDILGDEESEKYTLLKDSDFAQYQLSQLQQGLSGASALTTEQQSQLLLSKLTHQREFERTVAGLVADHNSTSRYNPVNANSRNSIARSHQQALKNALQAYKRAYLSDSAAFLGEEQFTRLKAFEGAQFEALLESLQQQVPTLKNEN